MYVAAAVLCTKVEDQNVQGCLKTAPCFLLEFEKSVPTIRCG